MAIKYLQTFEVKGNGAFPLDMLRYDRCFPATESDSRKIADTEFSVGVNTHSIKLCRYVSVRQTPTVDRWNSFLWKVVPDSITI